MSTVAHTAAFGGRSRRTRKSSRYTQEDKDALLLLLLELFADVNDVFTETDAMSQEKLRMGMGRMYRAWKRVCIALDPDFRADRYKSGPIK